MSHLPLIPDGDQWVTYVLECRSDREPERVLGEAFASDGVQPTDDPHVHTVGREPLFRVDHSTRFWRFHTAGPICKSQRRVRDAVTSRVFHPVYLPAGHLMVPPLPGMEMTSATVNTGDHLHGAGGDLTVRVRGTPTVPLLRFVADRYQTATVRRVGFTGEDPPMLIGTDRTGRVVTRGAGFDAHCRAVTGVVRRYERFVDAIEDHTLTWELLSHGGGRPTGGPLEVTFAGGVGDVDTFTRRLLSCRWPFRLWGLHDLARGVAEVEAVDIPTGHRLRFDIADGWMRIYVLEGTGGNTIGRLLSNLQNSFGRNLRFVDDDIRKLVEPEKRLRGSRPVALCSNRPSLVARLPNNGGGPIWQPDDQSPA